MTDCTAACTTASGGLLRLEPRNVLIESCTRGHRPALIRTFWPTFVILLSRTHTTLVTASSIKSIESVHCGSSSSKCLRVKRQRRLRRKPSGPLAAQLPTTRVKNSLSFHLQLARNQPRQPRPPQQTSASPRQDPKRKRQPQRP